MCNQKPHSYRVQNIRTGIVWKEQNSLILYSFAVVLSTLKACIRAIKSF